MVAAAEFNGKHLMIGHNMRFDPSPAAQAKKLLDEGRDGDVITFRVMGNAVTEGLVYGRQLVSSTRRRPRWARCPTSASTGIDLLQYLTGAEGHLDDGQGAHPEQARHRGPPHRRRRQRPCASCA